MASYLECGSKVSLISSGLTKCSESSVVSTDAASRALLRLLPSHKLNLGEKIKLVSLTVMIRAGLFLSRGPTDRMSHLRILITELTVFSTLDLHQVPHSVLLLSVDSSRGRTGRSASF